MKRYFRYFLGILGSTLLGQPSTLSAEFIPQKPTSPPTSNDSFLGKLTEVSKRSTRDGSQDSFVGFTQHEYTANEDEGFAKIAIERGCSDKYIPSAKATTCYSGSGGCVEKYDTVEWNVNECGIKYSFIPIIDNSIPEFTKRIMLDITDIQGAFRQGTYDDNYPYYDSYYDDNYYYLYNDNHLLIYDDDNENANAKVSTLSLYAVDTEINEGTSTHIEIRREGCEPHSPAISATLGIAGTADKNDYHYDSYPKPTKDEEGNLVFSWNEANDSSDCYYSKSLYFTPNDDAILEDTETVELTLSNPMGGTIIEPSNITLNIIDNDGSTIGFSQSNYVKGRDFATITVERKNCVKGYIPVGQTH